MAVIKVPKTPKKSFNKNRPASVLLRGQIEHLEWAVLPASRRNPRARRRKVKTEGQAAERVAQLLAMLPEPGDVPPLKLPPLPKAETPARRASTRVSGPRRRTAKTTAAKAKRKAGQAKKRAGTRLRARGRRR